MPAISVVFDESLHMFGIVLASVTTEQVWQVVLSLSIQDWIAVKAKSETERRHWGAEMLLRYRDMLCMCQHHNA